MPELASSGASRRRSVGDSTKDRRPRLKELASLSAQERRRQAFISSQKQARRNLSDHARLLAAIPSEEFEHAHHEQDSAEAVAGWGGVDRHGKETMAVENDQAQERHTATTREGESTREFVDDAETVVSNSDVSFKTAISNTEVNNNEGAKRTSPGSSSTSQRSTKRRDHWAGQLCTPEWMLTVPTDLNGAGSPTGAGWYVMARPEGKRVLIISAKGETVARQMSGNVTHRFSSYLPGGSKAGRRGGSRGDGYCILDCVFHELDQTFFVLDMMAWKGYPLYDCNADFRFYWVRTKLLEADGPLEVVSPRNAYRIKSIPYHECDRQGLAHAYSSPVPFIKDGLLFHLKAAHYQLGPTPLVMLWKDDSVARYLGVKGPQAVVLRVGESGADEGDAPQRGKINAAPTQLSTALAYRVGERSFDSEGSEHRGRLPLSTCDGICLAMVGDEDSATFVPDARPNDLVRFTLDGAEEQSVHQFESGERGIQCIGGIAHALQFQKRCSKLRPMADTWSKVLFQARLRSNSGVTVNDIDTRCVATDHAHVNGGRVPDAHVEEGNGAGDDDDDML